MLMEKEGEMGKRKIKCTPVAVLVALLALFLSAGIAAAADPPNSIDTPCVLVKSDGTPTLNTVKAAPLTTGPFAGIFPIPGSAFSLSGSVWRYSFSGSGSQFGALVPVCDPINDEVNSVNYTGNNYYRILCDSLTCRRASDTDPVHIYNPASGQTSSNWGGWGIWDGNENIIEQTNLGTNIVGVGTDNDARIPLRRTSMQFKIGNNLLFCANIAGPGCYARQAPPPPPPLAQYSVNTFRVITTADGMQFCLSTDPVTECEKAVYCMGDLNIPEGKAPGDELPYQLMTDIGITLTSGYPSTLQDIAIPGLRCPIVVLRDADPDHTIGVCNPVTKRCY
jgi:hypothetical protein